VALGAALVIAVLAPAAVAQQPPREKPPLPQTEQSNPKACVHERETVGKGDGGAQETPPGRSLSDKLAQSNGVICPPPEVDPAIKAPTPPAGKMPVIPPPGGPGGEPEPVPK
jgi:hypothetical protein